MVGAVLLLAAPVVAAALFWGSWGWMAAAAAAAVVEYVTLRRTERFSARLWRAVPVGRRRNREQAMETTHAVAAVAGLVLLVVAALLRV